MIHNYNLIYWSKLSPDKKILARKVMAGHYSTLDPETGEKKRMTVAEIKRGYTPDKGNVKSGMKASRQVMGKARGVRTETKQFAEYLNSGKS